MSGLLQKSAKPGSTCQTYVTFMHTPGEKAQVGKHGRGPSRKLGAQGAVCSGPRGLPISSPAMGREGNKRPRM